MSIICSCNICCASPFLKPALLSSNFLSTSTIVSFTRLLLCLALNMVSFGGIIDLLYSKIFIEQCCINDNITFSGLYFRFFSSASSSSSSFLCQLVSFSSTRSLSSSFRLTYSSCVASYISISGVSGTTGTGVTWQDSLDQTVDHNKVQLYSCISQ